MTLNFRVTGRGAPLIILHGLFGSLDNWHSISERLGTRFHVFRVDQRNHGRSPHAEEMSYPLMAQDVCELMQAQGLKEAFVLGHSMGAKTAMQLALSHPEKVRALISADLAPRAYAPHHKRMLAALLGLNLSAYASRLQLEQALEHDIPDLATRRFLLKSLERSISGTFHWRIGLHQIAANYARLGHDLSAPRPFTGPALFLRGEHSAYLTPMDWPRILDLFPRARLENIPSSGHLLHVDNPDAFLRAVLEFLARH